MAHDSETVRNRVIHDATLRERVAALLAKYADYLVALGASATEEQKVWAAYVLSDKHIPDAKATMMMWRVCWNAAVIDTETDAITDATLSGIVEPVALLY